MQGHQKGAKGVLPTHLLLEKGGFPDIPMKIPKRLAPLLEEGLIDEVIGQLMSGKEATVYVVRSGDSTRCAKVYKDAKQRSFRQAASYREGRTVKNSRQARA